MDFRHLHYKIENQVAWLTLDRPPVNALNRELVEEFAAASVQAESEVSAGRVRAVILNASGKHFCAGADLVERRELAESEIAPTVRKIGEAISKFAQISAPTIAAIQGSAIGGGFEMALGADIRIMLDSGKVGLRETALAIIPGAGGTQRLTRLIGPSKAILWVTTARLFSAQEALAQGAVNFVVESETELWQKAKEIADEIAQNGPLAVRQAKKAILQGLGKSLEEGLAFEFDCYQKVIPTKDRLEGLAAFQEKRTPEYKGV